MADPYDEDMLLQDAYEAENVVEPGSVTPWVPTCISVDATHIFSTSQIFETRDDLLVWARNVGKENGFVVVITRSDNGNNNRKEFVLLGCERHGTYKPYKDPGSFKYQTTGTRKSACPFKLKGRPRKAEGGWWLKVMCGLHNHEAAASLVGHSYVGRLSAEEKGVVEDMASTWVAPRHMLLSLKQRNAGNLSTITQVYTWCKKFRRSSRGPLTEMQQLMKFLARDRYVHWERTQANSDVLRNIFWAHPDALKLFNTFPHVVIMDCTYKTNRYRIPLLEMVGMTSTDMTFSIAFCYMSTERTEDYTWALGCMKSLIANPPNTPSLSLSLSHNTTSTSRTSSLSVARTRTQEPPSPPSSLHHLLPPKL